MSSHTQLAAAMLQEAETAGYTQAKLAERARMTQGAISQLIGRGYRAAPTTLKRLTACWPNSASGMKLLTAHLRDEIKRAGKNPHDFDIRYRGNTIKNAPSQLDQDLDYLKSACDHIPILRSLIHDIAGLTKDEVLNSKAVLKAAEGRVKYGSDKKH